MSGFECNCSSGCTSKSIKKEKIPRGFKILPLIWTQFGTEHVPNYLSGDCFIKTVSLKNIFFLEFVHSYCVEMRGVSVAWKQPASLLILKEAESRWHGMCSVCMTDKYSKKCCNFCECSEFLCKGCTDRQFK